MAKKLEETLEFLCLGEPGKWENEKDSAEFYYDDTEEEDDYFEREVQIGKGYVKKQEEYKCEETDESEEDEEYEEEDEYEETEEYEEEDEYEDECDEDEEDGIRGIFQRDSHIRSAKRRDRAGKCVNSNDRKDVGSKISNMDMIDRVVAITGAAILIVALAVGGVYAKNKATVAQVSSFEEIGTEMEGITIIGESGLLAMSDAWSAKTVVEEVAESTETAQEFEEKEYEEKELYEDGSIEVEMHLSSMQKDLKIKFINKKTGKLIPSVPFEVDITTADKKNYVLKDEDMNGIIYQTEVAPGKCNVAMLEIEGADEYAVSTEGVSITVKDKIEYKKVDVADEVKKESEVDAAVEDTKRHTTEETALADTVDFVESSKNPTQETADAIAGGEYEEVSKDKITDPMTVAGLPGGLEVPALTQSADEITTVCANPMGISEKTESVVTSLGTQIEEISTEGTQTEVLQPKSTQPEGQVTEVKITVDCTELTLKPGETYRINAATEPVGSYGAWASSNPAVATVQDGIVTAVAEGQTDITVTTATGNSALCKVTVVAAPVVKPEIKINATSAKVYVGKTIQLSVEVTGLEDKSITWQSGHEAASVAQDGTVTGISPGTAEIKAICNGDNTVTATCTVTVLTSPDKDTETRLKDNDGNQLYVIDTEGNFREAVYADYYTADKFYKKTQQEQTQESEYKYTGWQTIDGKTYYFDANGNKVTGEQIIQGVRYTFDSDGVLSTASGTMGIDVSKWNGAIDWNAVKNAGVSYVIIRCGYRGSTTGALIEDPTFRTNIQGASSAGLKVGIYFFTQAVNEVEAVEEASMVAGLINGYQISYPVFLDVEPSGGRADGISVETRTAVCRAFCQTMQNSGYTAGIYANSTWLQEKINTASLTDYKIWLAQYSPTATYNATRYDLWQYSAKGKIAGISGETDLNISYLGY